MNTIAIQVQTLLDVLLGWVLAMHLDVALVIVAVLSVCAMLLVRRLLTSRSRLRAIEEDIHQLKSLIKTARREGDSSALNRHRRNRARVAWQQVRAEFISVLVSTLLFAGMVTWCERHFRHQPLPAHSGFQLRLELPAGQRGRICHLVPLERVSVTEGWVRMLRLESLPQGSRAVADWTLQAEAGRHALQIRNGEKTLKHDVAVGQRAASAVRIEHPGIGATVIDHAPLQPFGLRSWPWLYALIVVPGYLLGRWLI